MILHDPPWLTMTRYDPSGARFKQQIDARLYPWTAQCDHPLEPAL